jgi:hypothetical protein
MLNGEREGRRGMIKGIRQACDDEQPRRSLRGTLFFATAVLGLLNGAFWTLPVRAAEDILSEPDPGLAREQWREHVRETKRRVQEEAALRRLETPRGRAEPSQQEEARRASESVLSDDKLVPGDVIMTDKGMFLFRGRSNEADVVHDFEPIDSPPGMRANSR